MFKYIYSIVFISLGISSIAQEAVPLTTANDSTVVDTLTEAKKIEVDEVEVIKAFEVKLGEAKRIAVGPKLEKVTPIKNEYKYDITIVPADIDYPDPVIKPLAMNPDAEPNIDHFYTKLGYGTFKSPYADLNYYNLVPELYSFTIDAHHYGFDNSSVDKNQKIQETKLNLTGDYLLGENNIIGIDLNGKLSNRNLKEPQVVPPTELNFNRQVISLGGKIHLKNAETTTKFGLDYNAYIAMQHLEISDNKLLVDKGNEEQDMSAGASITKKIGEDFRIKLDVDADFNTIHIDTSSSGSLTLEMAPGIMYNKGKFSVAAAADLILDENGLSPWVDAELGVEVTPGIQVYVGADQELMRNNLISSIDRNPYVLLDSTFQENSISKKLYGGIRGTVLNKISFDVSGAYEDITNQYYFSDFSDFPTFDVAFQDVKNIAIDANIEFKLSDALSIGGSLSQNIFDPSETEELTNIPSYHYEAYARAALINKRLHLKGGLALSDRVFYNDGLGQLVSGNSLTDISIEIDYYITKNIAVWARGNNLLNQSYERFEGYDILGLNANGGVIIKF